jgi:hypothetical protein
LPNLDPIADVTDGLIRRLLGEANAEDAENRLNGEEEIVSEAIPHRRLPRVVRAANRTAHQAAPRVKPGRRFNGGV